MHALTRRLILAALTTAAQLSTSDILLAEPAAVPPIEEDKRLLPYVQPG
jgi:hypothetical protein